MENKVKISYAIAASLSCILLFFAARMTMIATSAGIYGLRDIYASAVAIVGYLALIALVFVWLPRARALAFVILGAAFGFFVAPCADFYQKLMSFAQDGDFQILHLMAGGWFFALSFILLLASIVLDMLGKQALR